MPSKHAAGATLCALLLAIVAIFTVTAGMSSAATEEDPAPPDDSEGVNEPRGDAGGSGGSAAPSGAETTIAVDSEAEFIAALDALDSDNSGPHTINITGSFSLTGGTDPLYDSTATQPLTINGNGFAIDATDSSRILFNDSSQPVTINDLTAVNGDASVDGGAIYSEGDLTLNRCLFEGNVAGDDGGAVHVQGASLIVSDSTFTDNEANDEAGALRQKDAGTTTVTNSHFLGNVAVNGGGGAIEINGTGLLTVIGSTFTDNDASSQGGAIEASLGDAVIRTSSFIDNTSRSDGGAVDTGGDATVTDSLFDGNTAAFDGGAIDTSEDGSLDIDGSTFVRNSNTEDDADGGAVEAEASITALNSTFTQNTGGEDVMNAEGAVVDGDVTLRYVTFVDNETVQNDPQDGNIDTDSDTGVLTSFGSVFARNTPNTCEPDFASVVSEGHNFADDDSCGLNGGPGDVENGPDPQVEPLGAFGGPTPTRPPALPDSPLIDAIPVPDCLPGVDVDQRNLPRPEDGDGDGTNGCDIGAVEVQAQEEEPPDVGPVDATPPFTG
jgi:predicted outer membrane repeat protein